MKFDKVDYYILTSRNFEKYGRITARELVAGYTPADYPTIAIKNINGWWYVDHITTGLGIVTIGCKTRAAALKEFEEHYAGAVERLEADRDKIRKAVETFENAPIVDDVEKWEMINFCTIRDHRFDKVTEAAKRARLIIKKADDISYTAGGNVNIIGDPAALAPVKDMIDRYKEADTIGAFQDAINDAERRENDIKEAFMIKFTENAVFFGECEFAAVYNYKEDPAAVIIDITSAKTGREYAPIIIERGSAFFETVKALTPAASAADPAGTDPAGSDDFMTVDPADAEKDDMEFLYSLAEDAAPAPKKARKDRERKPATLDLAKAARGPVPEKDFIGTEITGRGWRILFDGEENRTRVIFEKCPTKEVRQIVKDAGFYWAPSMGSWNKKLTFKAYRAALELAKALQDVRRIAA